MTVILFAKKLTYVSVPKVACTSIKHLFFELENQRQFNPFIANGKKRHIHNTVYPSIPYNKLPHEKISDHRRLAVVRDPVDRFLSCYSNRVVFHGALAESKVGHLLREYDLPCSPDLAEYIEKFEHYRAAVNEIRNHSKPQWRHLGKNPEYYHALYPIKRLPEFLSDIESVVGQKLELRRLQAGGPKISRESLEARQLRKIRDFYEMDYELFGEILHQPQREKITA